MKKLYKKISLLFVVLLFPALLFSQSNQYLHFDKVDDYAQLDNASQYIPNANAISITGWFYTDALGYGQGMMGLRSGGQGFYLIILNNGTIECRLRSSTGLYEYVAPANSIVPQMWQHVAWIYDGTSVKLYMNGILKGSSAATGVLNQANVPFGIGKSLLGGFNFVYGGRIDEVTMWKKALTEAEIQDMMTNELQGNEADLELYYKFNQGVPNGNNTSITSLISEVGGSARDAVIYNFALNGNTSNFGGTLNPGFQAISFPQIAPKLTSDLPFILNATASSGLPVTYTVTSGPATVLDSTVTLAGTAGDVVIKATQPGGGSFTPAAPVINTFSVYDPQTHVPEIDVRSPLAGDVIIPSLKKMQIAAIASITVPELFSVTGLHFEINGTPIATTDHLNGHYTAWWTPPTYGSYTLTVISTNNFGASATETVNFNVIADTADQDVIAAQGLWLNTDVPTLTVDANLPVFVGAFSKITATLQVSCPSGGCGAWDRVASVDAKGHDGKWFEIIRYITPYGVPCSHNIDLTDYMSLMSGKISFRFNCGTLDNGYLYKLTIHYNAGIPAYSYSNIYEVWNQVYQFGDYANLQPVLPVNYSFPGTAMDAKLKLVSTGHGWGDLNTSNAAEFYEATHHIWVNNAETFTQHNWYTCNPNPDGCQPQSGTWYYNRAGWCPGAIAQWYDYSMTSYINGPDIELKYVFFPDYVDQCHPNNPNCVTGVTCTNCQDGYNPMLDVACNLVVFGENPIIEGIDDPSLPLSGNIKVYPNPTTGLFNLTSNKPEAFKSSVVRVFTPSGKQIDEFRWNGDNLSLDYSKQGKGVYFIKIMSPQGIGMKKFVIM